MAYETFGETSFEISKEDIKSNPKNPIVRMYDDSDLVGKFSIESLEIIENIDMADYDIRFAEKYLKQNQKNLLETWNDYVTGVASA